MTAVDQFSGEKQWRAEVASALDLLQLKAYTVATLPDAATYPRGVIYVSDGTSNQRLAISDGTDWRFPSGSVVS